MQFIINFEHVKSLSKSVCAVSASDFAKKVSTVQEYRDEQAYELQGHRAYGLPVEGLSALTNLATYATIHKASIEGSDTIWAIYDAEGLQEAEIIARCVAIHFEQDRVAFARLDDAKEGKISCGKLVGPNVSAYGGKFNKDFFIVFP